MIRVAHPGWAGCPAFAVPVVPVVEIEGFVAPADPPNMAQTGYSNTAIYFTPDKSRCVVIIAGDRRAVQAYMDFPHATYLGLAEYDPEYGLGHFHGAREWLDEYDLAYMGY